VDALLTAEQARIMEAIIAICDRNPVIKWRDGDPNHNQDFCLVDGKIEPVKSFCLKCIYTAGLSLESEDAPQVAPVKLRNGGDDSIISISATVYSQGGPRYKVWGASSIRECDGYGKNKRTLHEALARAQTRALKIAVETALGKAFINEMIQTIFGGFEIHGSPANEGVAERSGVSKAPNMTTAQERQARAIWERIWNLIHTAEREGILATQEVTSVTEEVRGNMTRINILKDIETKWLREIQTRTKEKPSCPA
jgi:hypothetical protein